MSQRKRPRRPSIESEDSGSDRSDDSGSEASSAGEEEAKGTGPVVSEESEGSDDDASGTSASGSDDDSGDDSDDSDDDEDMDDDTSTAQSSLVPPGFALLTQPSACALDSIRGRNKELWLFRVPQDFDASAVAKRKIKLKLGKQPPTTVVGKLKPGADGDKSYTIRAGPVSMSSQLVNMFSAGDGSLQLGKPFRRSFVIAEDAGATDRAFGKPFVLKDQRVQQVDNIDYVFTPLGHGSKLDPTVAMELEEQKEEDAKQAAAVRAARHKQAVALAAQGPPESPTKKSPKKKHKSKKKRSKKDGKQPKAKRQRTKK